MQTPSQRCIHERIGGNCRLHSPVQYSRYISWCYLYHCSVVGSCRTACLKCCITAIPYYVVLGPLLEALLVEECMSKDHVLCYCIRHNALLSLLYSFPCAIGVLVRAVSCDWSQLSALYSEAVHLGWTMLRVLLVLTTCDAIYKHKMIFSICLSPSFCTYTIVA